ncbi:MAG: hypothetical protein ACI4KH_02485 [Oscillospiraceae bacterium]
MAEFGMPFDMPQNPENPDDFLFSATEERMRIGAEMTDGVFPELRITTTDVTAPEQVIGNSLCVKAGNGLNVLLEKGGALCGSTYYFNTEQKIIPVTAGATNDIVVQLDLAASKISVIVQPRASGNIEDSLIRTASKWQIALATVTVPSDSTSVTFDMITDHRLNTTACSTPDGRPVCGIVGSVMQLSSQMILDEWKFIKGQLSEDPAAHLLEMIGNLNDLNTENKENLVKAINESLKSICGIPVDLTGIYNTQVIGYDEESGKLVPMINVARTETVIPNAITPAPWELVVGEYYDSNDSTPYVILNTTCPTGIVRFTNPYIISEFTKVNVGVYHYNTSVVLHKIRFSKSPTFDDIDAEYSFKGWSSNNNSTYISMDITSLIGSYYIEVEMNYYPDGNKSNGQLYLLTFSQ